MTNDLPLRAEVLYEVLEQLPGERIIHRIELAELCGVSTDTVWRAISDLTEHGIISIETIQRTDDGNSYVYYKFTILKKLFG